MKTLRQWLGLCDHQWKDIYEINVFGLDEYDRQSKFPIYRKIVQKCKKCQNIRTFKV